VVCILYILFPWLRCRRIEIIRNSVLDRHHQTILSEKFRKLWSYCNGLFNSINHGTSGTEIVVNRSKIFTGMHSFNTEYLSCDILYNFITFDFGL